MERALGALELLSAEPRGLPLQEIAERLGMPKSGAHRLMAELITLRYAVQDLDSLRYVLTTKLMSLGFRQLGNSGILEIAQPVLNRLASLSGELVRLAVVDNGRLPFVAKAQGARSGLRYDPDMGAEAALYCAATGHAWLATLPDDEALACVARQGFTLPEERGARAPKTLAEVMDYVSAARARGYARTVETWAPGMASMAAVVADAHSSRVFGVLSISGPSVRMNEDTMHALAPDLLAAAAELSAVSPLSQYLGSLNSAAIDTGRQSAA